MENGERKSGKPAVVVLGTATSLMLVGLVVFLVFDFRALRGESSAQRQADTYTSSVDADHPLPLESDLDFYLLGSGILAEDLGDELAKGLSPSRYVGGVNIRQEPVVQPATGSILVVEVTKQSVLWTPLYSRADLTMRVMYASDGQAGWDNAQVMELSSGHGPTARIRALCEVHDSAYGVMSLGGYHGYLNEKIAAEISQLIDASLSGAGR
jgi:hypothetical protein